MIVLVLWVLIQVGYDHQVKTTRFDSQELCEASRSFLTMSTKDSYCVDP